MFFCATKEPKPPGVRYLPDPEPLGASPKTPCKQLFSVLQNLLQTNVTRVIYILNVMHPAFTAAMHTPLLHIYLRFGFRRNLKMLNNLLVPPDLTLAIFLLSRLLYFAPCSGGYYPPDLTLTNFLFICDNFGVQKPPSLRESGRFSGGRSKNPILQLS